VRQQDILKAERPINNSKLTNLYTEIQNFEKKTSEQLIIRKL